MDASDEAVPIILKYPSCLTGEEFVLILVTAIHVPNPSQARHDARLRMTGPPVT